MTFSIIVFESLRRIARWVVVFAVISFFCKLANTTVMTIVVTELIEYQ